MLKKVSVIAVALGILLTGVVNADVIKDKEGAETEVITCEFNWDNEKLFLEDLKVSDEDYAKLKDLVDDITDLESKGKHDDAEKKWNEYLTILEKYYGENEIIAFDWEDEAAFLKSANVIQNDINSLESIFKAALQADKDNNVIVANEKWVQYFNEFNKVVPVMGLTATISFDDEKEFFETLKVSEDDMKALEDLFKEISSLEGKGDFDESEKAWNKYETILQKYDIADFTFEMEKEYLEAMKVDAKDMTALEALFNQAVKLEKEEKHDDAKKIWEEYDKIMSKYNEVVDFSFDILKEDYSDLNLKPEEEKALDTAFEKALSLEKAEKYDEADKAWDAYYKLLDQYKVQ